jgi:8-demethyl-8-alpha-L-rhamnosyltetracenomycin-C 2'-O-methyltransferase
VASLCELFAQYPTDKNTAHSYGPIYDQLLDPRRSEVRRVLEIGVHKGASLRAWRDYFPQAQVVGLDCCAECMFSEPRITTILGQAASPECLESLAAQGPWDLVVDDGSHELAQQLAALLGLWSSVRRGGLYTIEDVREHRWVEVLSALPGATVHDLRSQKGLADDILVVLQKR